MVYCELQTTKLKKLHEFMAPEERNQLFKDNENGEPDYEIISIKWPKHHKRSDNAITLSLRAFDRDINLNVQKMNPLIVGPQTAIYDLSTNHNGSNIVCDKRLPFQNMDYKLFYEDEGNLASLIIDMDANDKQRIQTAIIGAHNITIQRVPEHVLNRVGNGLNKTDYYVAQKTAALFDNIAKVFTSAINQRRNKSNQTLTIPDVIYPEVLLIVDTLFLEQTRHPDPTSTYDFSLTYLLLFWHQVNMLYNSLDSPKYKISIAGIVIPQRNHIYDFIEKNRVDFFGGEKLYYEEALLDLQEWLYSHENCIPLDSYDVAIFHSVRRSQDSILNLLTLSTELGLASLSSACNIDHTNKNVGKVGLIYDNCKYSGVIVAAHELAHTLGAEHDTYRCSGLRGYLMSSAKSKGPNKYKWSKCSLIGFERFLRTNPTCLFNTPEQFQIAENNKNEEKNKTVNHNMNDNNNTDLIIINYNNNNTNKDINKDDTNNDDNYGNIPDVGPYLNKTIPGTDTKLSEINFSKPFLRTNIAPYNNIFVMDPRKISSNKMMLFMLKDSVLSLYMVDQSIDIAGNIIE